MEAALLALVVACIWGLNPVFEKLALNGATPFAMITIRFAFTTVCLLVIMFTTSRVDQILEVDRSTLFWILLSGLAGGLIGLFLFFVALKQDDASRIVPIVASFPMFTAFYAYIFLKENISTLRLVGIAFVVIGLILINWRDLATQN